jgi:hypothetical protein
MEQRSPELRFKLEEVESVWPQLVEMLGFTDIAFPREISTTTNGKKTGRFAALKLTWDDLRQADIDAYSKVRRMAERYGYG